MDDRLCKKGVHHVGRDGTGQFLVQALESESQLVVVDAQAMQNRCIEISHMHRVFHDVIAVVVRLPEWRRRSTKCS